MQEDFSWSKFAETITWVLLFALIPLTILGYFSEGSIPGQPLYPLKRGIENLVLAVDSFNASAKAFYRVALVDKRLAEAEKLLASSDAITQVNVDDISTTLEAAKQAIYGISDSVEKKQVAEKLLVSISDYQVRLQQLKTIIQNTPTVSSTTNSGSNLHTSGSSVQNQQNRNSGSSTYYYPTYYPTNSQQQPQGLVPTTSPIQQQTIPVATPIPTIDTSNMTAQEQQQTIQSIDQLSQTIQQAAQDVSQAAGVPLTPAPPPPPPLPSPSPTVIPRTIFSPSPTPTPFHGSRKDNSQGGDQSSNRGGEGN